MLEEDWLLHVGYTYGINTRLFIAEQRNSPTVVINELINVSYDVRPHKGSGIGAPSPNSLAGVRSTSDGAFDFDGTCFTQASNSPSKLVLEARQLTLDSSCV